MTSQARPAPPRPRAAESVRAVGSPPRRRRGRVLLDRGFALACKLASALSIVVLLFLLIAIGHEGVHHLDADFLSAPHSRFPDQAGIGPALWGTVWLCVTCGLLALPMGIGTAVLLEEYQPRHRFLRRLHAIIQLNITNLAGVPSIVYGIIGLTAFVQMFGLFGSALSPTLELGTPADWFYLRLPFGRGVLAGAFTLMLVILPILIIATQEALRAVPDSLRESSYALGATRWQTVAGVTLPAALPGIMTGAILAMSRAIGEAAPILVVCGIVYITSTPQHLMDSFTAMPLQIFDWAGRPQDEYHRVAATGIIVLLAALLTFNSLAVFIRHRYQKPLQ